ncbi:hypothetical protein [Hyphomicrobium sp. CS1GBMeth3]|uniref:hypothetical protein n=1 Tax=Hyphomicrobium sp. CS1GBMeth3 TaxID=1892845 RepID=UPI000930C45E|nr:hypothetical protein [Hyphomicrobium sp. CS1GBMeth3]
MLNDGVYGLRFHYRPDAEGGEAALSTEGLAVLRDGRVLGSDRNGGVFKGRCRYDAARGEAVVEVRLAVPPHGVLLTGLEAGPEGAILDVSGCFSPSQSSSSTVIEIGDGALAVELRFFGPLA